MHAGEERTMEEFIRKQLQNVFPSEADQLFQSMEKHLAALTDSHTGDDAFQDQLEKSLYPLLACIEVLRESGRTEEEAVGFARSMWEKIMA